VLTDDKKDYFRSLLNERLAALQSEAKRPLADPDSFGEEPHDIVDEASAESDRGFAYRIIERESKLIGKIRKALVRLEEGGFGICEKCSKDIGLERLEARPMTTLCIKCKRKQEAREKLRGE
jgi:DnaK suppressor protein